MAANGDGLAPRWRTSATLMYPAAVCPPPSPGRFGARPATARRRRRPSAPSAERRSRRRRGRGREASIAKSCRIGFGSTGQGTPRSGEARRSARVAWCPPPSSPTDRSRRTSWCSRGRLPLARTHHTSTTRRRGSTNDRLRHHRLRHHRSCLRRPRPVRPQESSSSLLLPWRQQSPPLRRRLPLHLRRLRKSMSRNSPTSRPSHTSPPSHTTATPGRTTGSVEGPG